MRRRSSAVLGLLLLGAAARADEACSSLETELRVVATRAPRHDADYGAAGIELRSRDGRKLREPIPEEGVWRCLGYAPGIHSYVLGGILEVGAWLPLDRVVYLNERTFAIKESTMSSAGLTAMASVVGPGTRFIAFVASHADADFKLYALETATDRWKILGAPPAPPPLKDPALDSGDGEAGWARDEGTIDVDPGIIVFRSDHVLRVSYGDDTKTARSPKRTVKEWDLQKLFKD